LPANSPRPVEPRRRRARPALAGALLLAAWPLPAPGQGPTTITSTPRRAADSARGPDGPDFANGLLRDRRYDLAAEEYERFLKTAKPGPGSDEARFGLANARLFQGKFAEARRQFEAFLQVAPTHPSAATARFRVGETAYMLGDLPAAREALERYAKEQPGHRHLDTTWPYLGDVCLRLGDLEAAQGAYERALADFPKARLADRARFGLGRTLIARGEVDAASKVLLDLAERGGPEWGDKARAEAGKMLLGAGRAAESIAAYEALEAQAPKSPLLGEARLGRAEGLIKLGRREEAEALLAPLAGNPAQPRAAQAAYALGTSLRERGEPAEALARLDAALKRFGATSSSASLWFASAEAAEALNQPDDARARYLKAAEAGPNDPWADDALVRAAGLALEARDGVQARRLAASFATRFPESPLRADARLIEARATLAAGRAKEAIALLTAALADDAPSPAAAQAARYYLGLAYRADGQAAKAGEVLDALAKTPAAPAAVDAQYLLGQGHVEAGRFAEAIEPLERYLAAKPKGDVADFALAHLAHARLERRQPNEATAALDRLAAGFPKSKALAPTRLRLAEAALAAGELDRAATLFRPVAEPDTPEADPALVARARSGLGWTLWRDNKPAEAAEAFGVLLQAGPDDPLAPEAALVRGRALEAAKRADEATAAYALVVEKYPSSPQAGPAALARARLLASSGHPAEAAEAYQILLRDRPPTADAAEGARLDDLLADWGWALVDAGKVAEADAVFGRLVAEAPGGSHADDARLNLAESAFAAKDYAKVDELLAPLVEPGSKARPLVVRSALYRVGRARAERKDWPGAAEALDRLLAGPADAPFRREGQFWRAEVAFQSGDAKAAEAGFAPLVDASVAPGDGLAAAARRRRVQCLVQLERWKDALAAADAWASAAPDDPLAAERDYARGRSLQGLARFAEARDAYDAVILARKGGELAARAQLMRGETYFHEKDYAEALREFLKVDYLYEAPTWQALALLQAGKAHEQLAQWGEAAETYERFRAKFPDDPNAAEAAGRLQAARSRAAEVAAGGPASPATPR